MLKKLILINIGLALCYLNADYKTKIAKECGNYGSYSNLLVEICRIESDFDPYDCNMTELSHGGWQMRRAARADVNKLAGTNFTAVDMYNYKKACFAAYIYIKWQINIWGGDIYYALASYNAGRKSIIDNGVFNYMYPSEIIQKLDVLPDDAVIKLAASNP